MSPRKTADYANAVYRKGEIRYDSKADVVRLKKIAELMGENKKVLDIGCYDGTLGKMLIEKNNEVYGIEINQEVAEIAK
jgi:tRNA1(Val) A37 N6-methylase TrmN6